MSATVADASKRTRISRFRFADGDAFDLTYSASPNPSPMPCVPQSAPDLRLSAISLSPLRLWVIFSLAPKFLLSVLQEIGASPF
jgi:hypothetical protein